MTQPVTSLKGENVQNSKLKFDYRGDFGEGLARVEIDRKLGFINKQGELVIPCEYHEVGDFSEGFAKVKVNTHDDPYDFWEKYDFWRFIDVWKVLSDKNESIVN